MDHEWDSPERKNFHLQLKNSTELPYESIFARCVIIPRHNFLPQIKSLSEFLPKDTLDSVPAEDPTTRKGRPWPIVLILGKDICLVIIPSFIYFASTAKYVYVPFWNIKNLLASVKQPFCVFVIMPQLFHILRLWAIKDGSTCAQIQKSPEERK